MQNYRIYYTDMQLPPGAKQPDLATVIPLEFPTKEEAMDKAFKLIYHGAIVWKMDGPEGFHLERTAIEEQYWIFKST